MIDPDTFIGNSELNNIQKNNVQSYINDLLQNLRPPIQAIQETYDEDHLDDQKMIDLQICISNDDVFSTNHCSIKSPLSNSLEFNEGAKETLSQLILEQNQSFLEEKTASNCKNLIKCNKKQNKCIYSQETDDESNSGENKILKEKNSKKINKRIQYTTKGNHKSKQKKNGGGILRERIMKKIRAVVYSYHPTLEIIKTGIDNKIQFLADYLENLADIEKARFCKFLKEFDKNFKDPKKIKNKKNLKALKDMCEEYTGGEIFAKIIKLYLEKGALDILDWLTNFQGNPDTKEYIQSDELKQEVKKYLNEFWKEK